MNKKSQPPSFPGILYLYNPEMSPAFKSTPPRSPSHIKYLIFIDGMQGSMLTIPYYAALRTYCDKEGIVLVYPQLRSHPYFWMRPIQDDLQDLGYLIDGIEEDGDVVLFGHSTGCQDVLLYLQERGAGKVKGVVLQDPVSDIQANDDPDLQSHVAKAKQSQSNHYQYGNKVWLTQRFLSVYQPYNKEDLFSSYLPESSYQRWRKYCPILTILSSKSEYCKIDLGEKFALMGDVIKLKNANHAVDQQADQMELIDGVDRWLEGIGFVGKEFNL